MSRSFDDPRIAAGMRQQLALRSRGLDQGARQIGWKVGMGAPAVRQKLGLTAPIIGFLLDRALLPSGAEVSLQGWQKPVAEAEIAAYLGRDLAPGADRAAARAAIAALGPAIELADVDCPMDDIERVLAGDIFQRHVLLGPSDPTRALARLDGLVGRVTRSGQDVPVPADLETNIGEIVAIVQHVADVAGALGDGLRAGQFIICGSLTPPMFLEPGDSGIEFALDPVGSVSVGFSRPAA
jgi:2-keto-4-pentenoate hydratase